MNDVVIFYDSECLMCSSFVRFVLKYDTRQHFQFASLSSDFAKDFNLPLETVVVFVSGKTITHQHAVRFIIHELPKFKWMLVFFWITPNFIQKAMYSIVAKNRKRVFGSTQCTLAQTHKNRFIS